MAVTARTTTLVWRVLPVVALVALVATWGRDIGIAVVVVVALLLAGAVLAAVHHAEVVAHRVGEPFGSLVLAVAVTVIEVVADRHADAVRRCRGGRRWPATPSSPR